MCALSRIFITESVTGVDAGSRLVRVRFENEIKNEKLPTIYGSRRSMDDGMCRGMDAMKLSENFPSFFNDVLKRIK